ncbi:MAG: response regulator [Acidobacteriota bacterium]
MTTRSILLVDDDEGDVFLTTRALQHGGLAGDLHHCCNGREALAFLRREEPYIDAPRPSLVLLDLNMPIMDGRETLAAMKADLDLRTIPVVVLTTSDAEEERIRSQELQAACHVRKPSDLRQFTRLVMAIKCLWLPMPDEEPVPAP